MVMVALCLARVYHADQVSPASLAEARRAIARSRDARTRSHRHRQLRRRLERALHWATAPRLHVELADLLMQGVAADAGHPGVAPDPREAHVHLVAAGVAGIPLRLRLYRNGLHDMPPDRTAYDHLVAAHVATPRLRRDMVPNAAPLWRGRDYADRRPARPTFPDIHGRPQVALGRLRQGGNAHLMDLLLGFNRGLNTGPVDPTVMRSDTQNVHQRSVARTVEESLGRIRKLLAPASRSIPNAMILRGVRKHVAETRTPDVTDQVSRNALKSLDRIETSLATGFSSTRTPDIEVLCLVWRRINQLGQADPGLQERLRETLTLELHHMVERGHVVCTGGRSARLVGVLDGTDHEVKVVPDAIVNREVLDRAGVLSGQLEKQSPELGDQARLERVCDTLRAEYLTNGLVTPSTFNRLRGMVMAAA